LCREKAAAAAAGAGEGEGADDGVAAGWEEERFPLDKRFHGTLVRIYMCIYTHIYIYIYVYW
jgi:hypothetical protein